MTQSPNPTQDKTKYLAYAAIVLLIINFTLLFLPSIKVHQPSYSKTLLGVTTYHDWYTEFAPMTKFIVPIILPGIPYLCSIASIGASFRKKNNKNVFFKIINNEIDKPIKFLLLIIGSIVNVITSFIIYSVLSDRVEYLEKHGAYCRFTVFGILNICCSILLTLILLILSFKTKSMFTLVSKEQLTNVNPQLIENETTESEE